VLLYDPTKGETAQTANLATTLAKQGVALAPRPPPAPQQVLDAAFQRALERVSSVDPSLTEAFSAMLRRSKSNANNDNGKGGSSSSSARKQDNEESERTLAQALAALSGLSHLQPPRSLLTADQNDRTVRVWRTKDEEAMKKAKSMQVEAEPTSVEPTVEEKDAKKGAKKKTTAAAASKATAKQSSKSSNDDEFTVEEEVNEEEEGSRDQQSATVAANDDLPNVVRPAEVTKLVKTLGLGKV